MEVLFFIEVGAGLIIILAVTLFLLFHIKKKSKLKNKTNIKKVQTLHDLQLIIQDKNSSTAILKSTLELIIKDYGEIDNIDIYTNILFHLSRHQNADKKIIVKFNIELEHLNKRYVKEINNALLEGFEAR